MSHPDDRSGNLPSPSDKKTLQDELREVMADKSLTDDERIVRLCCHGWSGNMLALLAAPSHELPPEIQMALGNHSIGVFKDGKLIAADAEVYAAPSGEFTNRKPEAHGEGPADAAPSSSTATPIALKLAQEVVESNYRYPGCWRGETAKDLVLLAQTVLALSASSATRRTYKCSGCGAQCISQELGATTDGSAATK